MADLRTPCHQAIRAVQGTMVRIGQGEEHRVYKKL